jgi:nucleotide-binding universal stress UspA family protein
MFNILLVPLDGSPQSERVVDPSYFLPPGEESGVASDGLNYPPAHEQTSFAQSVLSTAAAQLADRNLTVKQHLCAGNPPADVVIEQARLLAAEVVVMGHHHLSWLHRLANPSTCGEVIEQSPCAVLIETRETS